MIEERYVGILLIASSIIVMVGAQLIIKNRLNSHGVVPLSLPEFSQYVLYLLRDIRVWLGGIGLVVSAILWYAAVSRVPLSVAFPLGASSYPLIFLCSVIWLGEAFTLEKLFANLLIISGVLILGLNASQ